jgi:thiol-disulfide isomerase/thioredoxin
MKMIFNVFLLSLTIFTAQAGEPKQAGSKGFNIKLTVKGLENTSMILANYYGDKQYVKDTFQFDSKAVITLKADTSLPGGVYLAVFPALNNRYFEFIAGEPSFTLSTDTTDLTGHMKTSGSIENDLFYRDIFFLADKKKTADSLQAVYKAEKDTARKNATMKQLTQIDKEVKDHRNEIITKQPDLFYAKLLKSMTDITVPDAPKDANGKVTDEAFQWRFYKAHYWDNVDLKDERLLRCPVLHNKLKTFMNQTTVQHPDSIIASGEDVLSKTDKKNEMYRYIVTYIFNEMANSKIMGFDNAYVYFAQNYFCKDALTPWIDTTKRFKICDRANRLAPVLIGKPAQRLILWTDSTETQWKNLYDLKNKWTVLAFWDPDCGHCKKEIPVLAEAYHKLKESKIDVEVYAPAIMDMDNYKDWREFIEKNNLDWINVCDAKRHSNFRYEWDLQSTPQLFVLDKDKKIVARRISADQIEDHIRHLEDPSYKPKTPLKVKDEDTQEGTED